MRIALIAAFTALLAGSAAAHDAAHCKTALTGGWAYMANGAGAPAYTLTLNADGAGEVVYPFGDVIAVESWTVADGKSATTCSLTMTAAGSSETNEITLDEHSFSMNEQGEFHRL